MSLEYNKNMIPRAKEMRKPMTKQERRLWYDFLTDVDPRFQRQKTIGRLSPSCMLPRALRSVASPRIVISPMPTITSPGSMPASCMGENSSTSLTHAP